MANSVIHSACELCAGACCEVLPVPINTAAMADLSRPRREAVRAVGKVDIAEFRAFGYLQEINRCFLHPLGFALEVLIDEHGNESLGGIWDFRDEPAGVYFTDGLIDPDKVRRVRAERERIAGPRHETYGWTVQPCETP